MARSRVRLDWELEGFDDTADRLGEIIANLRNMGGAAPDVFDVLEQSERMWFERLRGRYVRTGATRESLTQRHATNAIRDAHRNEIEFGSSVWYAVFLRRGKRSAVLRFERRERDAVASVIMDHVMRGRLR